jgi:hypothetical protein
MSQTDQSLIQSQLGRYRWPGLIVAGVGLVISIGGAFLNVEQFWQSYLLAFLFWLEIGLGCLAIAMLHHLVGGRWSFLIRRFMEAGASTLPLMALLFIPLLFGLPSLYRWLDAETVANSDLLQQKSAYLNLPFFIARSVFYFAVWIGLAYLLQRWSTAQDQTGNPALAIRLRRLSSIGLILYILTATFAAYDWMMSLEPEWFSSIYGLLFIAGQILAALALAVIGLRYLSTREAGRQKIAGADWANYFNDLGNFLLGFVMIWAYFSFSQYLIIWSANLPEEAIWYYHRSQGGWQWVGMFLIAFHFALPFFLLLSRLIKRRARLLTGLAILIFLIRIVDLYWLVVPALHPDGIHFHWLAVILFITLGGAWAAVFFQGLASRPLLSLSDPQMRELVHDSSEEFAAP